MINKFGYRLCSVVGGFIAATGLSLGFFANDILFLFFAHGIFTGESISIIQQNKLGGHIISYKSPCAPSEDSDQPAHQRSLIRVFVEHLMGSRGSKMSSGGQKIL